MESLSAPCYINFLKTSLGGLNWEVFLVSFSPYGGAGLGCGGSMTAGFFIPYIMQR